MACKDLNRNFTTSEASTKAWMRSRDLIDEYLNILDLDGFRRANQKWSKIAQKDYGTEGMLFDEEAYSDKIVARPVKENFRKIDSYKGIEYEQRDSAEEQITVEEFENQRQIIESATGFNIVFDRTAESATVQGDTITVNPDQIFRDTLIHEIAHIMIDSIGGLDNPMVRKGLENLQHTSLATDVREKYSDQPNDIIQKEILATAIGREGAEIFGDRQDRINKWERWLQLFFRRIKQVLGFERNIAKELAQDIIYSEQTFDFDSNQTYERRSWKDKRINTLQETLNKLAANMRSEMDILKRNEPENWEESYNKLKNLADHFEKGHIETAVRQYVEIGEDKINELSEKLDQDDLSINDLQRIREDLAPYEYTSELKNRLEDIEFENEQQKTELNDRAIKLTSEIERIADRTSLRIKEVIARKVSTNENGRIHQKYKQEFKDEFAEQNKKDRFLGILGSTYTVNGEKVTKGKYLAAREAYVNKKMDQYEEQIVEEEEDYFFEAFQSTPSDIGMFETYLYDSAIINDEIIQLITERVVDAETLIRQAYLESERDAVDLHDEFKEENGSPVNQKKKWGFLLANERDENGMSTGEKLPYIAIGEYSPAFVLQKRKLNQAIEDAKEEVARVNDLWTSNNAKYEQQKKDAIAERDRLEDKKTKWIKENTTRKDGQYVPTDKWKLSRDFNETQQKMYDFIVNRIKEDDSKLPASGKLVMEDRHIGEYMRLPNVPKSFVEKVTQDGLISNAQESFQQLYSPKADDMKYESIAQTARSRDNKLHYSIPIYFRGNQQDQSFDVLSTVMMNHHMSLNYEHKRSIEYEIKALQDIQREREVGETKSNFVRGQQKVKNMFGKATDLQLMQDKNEVISNRYKVTRGLINSVLYGVERQGDEKVNKMVDSLVQFTSLSILPFNVFSMVSNLTMGKATTFTELFGDSIGITGKDLRAGEGFYWRHLPETIGDSMEPKVKKIVNKLMEKYDMMGDFHGPTFRFAEDSKFKQLFSRSVMYIFQSAPEHYISGSLGFSVLHSLKIQNKNGDYIDTEGKTVDDRDKAATMLDYHTIGENDEVQNVEIPNAYQTERFDAKLGTQAHTNLVKNYIRDSVAQTQGQYDSKTFTMLETYAFGRMFRNLRTWMFRGIDRNWRGFSYIFADEIPEHIKMRSRQGGADEIGYQTQFAHTGVKSAKLTWKWIRGMEQDGQRITFDMVKQPWSDLKESEKGRIRKALVNWSMAVSAMVITKILASLDDEEEIPDETIYLMYALKRAQQELLFYSNPQNTYQILRSPAASINIATDFMSLLNQMASDTFHGELERYERGRFEGRSKFEKELTDILPVFSQMNRDVRASYDFLTSMATGR